MNTVNHGELQFHISLLRLSALAKTAAVSDPAPASAEKEAVHQLVATARAVVPGNDQVHNA